MVAGAAIDRAGRTARRLAGGVAGLVWPDVCGACGEASDGPGGLCAACSVELLGLVALPFCPRCGSTRGPGVPVRQDGCDACPTTLPRFARVVRLGPYAGPLRELVREMKYRRRFGVRGRLARLLAEATRGRLDPQPEAVVAVPMHWQRRLARGCDHARILAAAVARDLDLPLADELVRTRNTPPQTHLSRSRRIANVRGAFRVTRPAGIEGARVLLVDDVTTTGATASEAARTLYSAGAANVTLAVVAKAEKAVAYRRHLPTFTGES